LSQEQLAVLDKQVNEVIKDARQRSAKILKENVGLLETLRDLLVEKKTIDAKALTELVGEKPAPAKTPARAKAKA